MIDRYYLGGRFFEELSSTNGHGSWNMRIQLSKVDYISLTRQCGSHTAAQTVARFADLLQHNLSQKAAAFAVTGRALESIDRSEARMDDIAVTAA